MNHAANPGNGVFYAVRLKWRGRLSVYEAYIGCPDCLIHKPIESEKIRKSTYEQSWHGKIDPEDQQKICQSLNCSVQPLSKGSPKLAARSWVSTFYSLTFTMLISSGTFGGLVQAYSAHILKIRGLSSWPIEFIWGINLKGYSDKFPHNFFCRSSKSQKLSWLPIDILRLTTIDLRNVFEDRIGDFRGGNLC